MMDTAEAVVMVEAEPISIRAADVLVHVLVDVLALVHVLAVVELDAPKKIFIIQMFKLILS